MRDYSKVSPTFWTGKTGKALRARGSEAVIVGMYLLSSPHSNMLGLYYQPILYMAHETGLGVEGARKGLKEAVEEGFCAFDEDSEMVWVFEMASYQIASELKPSDNRCAGIQKDYDALQDNPFLEAFFEKYQPAFHLSSKRVFGEQKQAPVIAPSKPLRSQEQEQEQEQEQKQERESAAAQRTPRPKREDITLKAYLENCRADGVKPVPSDHPIRDYCRDAGITDEMLQVAWCVFRDDYTTGTNKAKRYKDWPGHFANAVRGCWGKLWFTDAGEVKWSSRGLQEKAVLDARAKARESTHEPA